MGYDPVDRKVANEIQGRYIGYIASATAPSLVDICSEWFLDEAQYTFIANKCKVEQWEEIRKKNIKKAKENLLNSKLDDGVDDIVANFKIAARGALAQRFMMLNKFSSIIDAQLEIKLEEGYLNTTQLLRFKELMLKEADAITKSAIEIAKIAGTADPESKPPEAETDPAKKALNKWTTAGQIVNATTDKPDTIDHASESERVDLFNKLKEDIDG